MTSKLKLSTGRQLMNPRSNYSKVKVVHRNKPMNRSIKVTIINAFSQNQLDNWNDEDIVDLTEYKGIYYNDNHKQY